MRDIIFYFRDNWFALAAFLLSCTSLGITLWKNVKDSLYASWPEIEKPEVRRRLTSLLGLAV
jgi:hypothetical protein